MKAYPKYKYSGLEWIGNIPEHWEMVRLGSQFVERKQKVNDKDFPPLSVTKGGILPQLKNAAKSKDGNHRKKVCRGDFVINSRSDRKGSSGVSPYTGSVSLISIVLTSLTSNERYVHNFFRSHGFQEEFYRVGRGIVDDLWSTKYTNMRAIMIANPPKEEQAQLAYYLDWQTEKINQFVTVKQKLIALLKEQKQSIISEAVTKGINCSVTLKDSGIEWIGKIPEHWKVRKIKQIAILGPSKYESLKNVNLDSEVTFLPMEKISEGGKVFCDNKISISKVMNGLTYFRKNDVILAKITPCFENGKGAFLDELDTDFGFGTTELFVIRPQKNISGGYLRLIMQSKQFLLLGKQYMSGAAGQQRVQSNFIKNFEVGLPSYNEQLIIVKHLKKVIVQIDKTISHTKREIELVQEYHTRLISDVVTGKIDVRSVELIDSNSQMLQTDKKFRR